MNTGSEVIVRAKRAGSPGRGGHRMLALVTALLILAVFNFPLLNTIVTSVKSSATILQAPPPLLFTPTTEQYRSLFSDPTIPFGHYLINSIILAIGAAVLTVFATLPAAYAVVRFNIGRRFLLPLITALRAIPLIVFAIPLYILFQLFHLIDTRLALVLVNALVNIPLALIVFVSSLQEVPTSLDEAARIDGCSTLQVFRRIIVPLSRPAIASVMILTAIAAWNEFLFGLILTVQKATPVTVGTTMFITSWTIKWGSIAAAITVATIPTLIFTLFARRYLVRGLTAGALKG